ncbi:hypothetical protein EUX98_g2250 [Antrodiella citrinella]|uniref:Uncharacterized protein n=1 Tax=Antrodiella citrinella TaxID=2447956 RepID=A0A4S4MZI4_9APHY|nr:hypothetical protein EUX98_g2250 [Antrodiella citrinella]
MRETCRCIDSSQTVGGWNGYIILRPYTKLGNTPAVRYGHDHVHEGHPYFRFSIEVHLAGCKIVGIISTDDEDSIIFSDDDFGHVFDMKLRKGPKDYSLTGSMQLASGTTHSVDMGTPQFNSAQECDTQNLCVFSGEMNFGKHALQEMAALVIPKGVGEGADIGIFHQWTIGHDGKRNVNRSITTKIKTTEPASPPYTPNITLTPATPSTSLRPHDLINIQFKDSIFRRPVHSYCQVH